jgi:hypothetical protein
VGVDRPDVDEVTNVKTTIEVPSDLLGRSKRLAQQEGTTLQVLIEEALRLVLRARAQRRHPSSAYRNCRCVTHW